MTTKLIRYMVVLLCGFLLYMNMINLPPECAKNLRCIYKDSDFSSWPVPGSLNDACTWPPVKLGLVIFIVNLASNPNNHAIGSYWENQ